MKKKDIVKIVLYSCLALICVYLSYTWILNMIGYIVDIIEFLTDGYVGSLSIFIKSIFLCILQITVFIVVIVLSVLRIIDIIKPKVRIKYTYEQHLENKKRKMESKKAKLEKKIEEMEKTE